MTPLQRARSELLVVRERFKARTTRRGRQNRNPQDQMPADVRDGSDTVVEQANKTTLRDKIRRTFSPRRGKLTVQLTSHSGRCDLRGSRTHVRSDHMLAAHLCAHQHDYRHRPSSPIVIAHQHQVVQLFWAFLYVQHSSLLWCH